MYIKMQPTLAKPESPSQVFSHCGLGGVDLEGVEVLVGLGLTGRQARVYLALLKKGDARAQAVARLARVPRQGVYGLLYGLQQLGLVRQNLTAPANYTPTLLSEAVKMLFEQKANELKLMSQRAKKITAKLGQTRTATMPVAPKPCFGTVYGGERGRKYHKAIHETCCCIEVVTSWLWFRQFCFIFETELRAALKKEVTIRIVTEKPPSHRLPEWVNAALPKYPNFKLKTTPDPPEAAITIFDQTQVAIAFNPNIRITKGPDLWTTHPALTMTCQSYFNANWAVLE